MLLIKQGLRGKLQQLKNKFDSKSLFRKYQEITTPSRNFDRKQRKKMNSSQLNNKNNFSDSKSTLKKKRLKLRQITFKKPKANKNKNSSEISTASNKNSKEFIFKSFISNDSKKTKNSNKLKSRTKGKNRGTLKYPDNLGIIQEERKNKNKRNAKGTANSGNQFLINRMNKDSFLNAHNGSLRRPTV